MHYGYTLRYVRAVAWAALISLCASLVYGASAGDFRADVAAILANPWGIVTLVDIYAGFALFSTWVIWREKRWWRAAAWVTLVLALGNLAAALYVLAALARARADPRRYWMGDRVSPVPAPAGIES